jgi:transcription antitermination factor NusG
VAESWHILCVEPNREVTAHAHLVGRRFRVYLPMVPRFRSAKNARQRGFVEMPMFRGYCFAFFDPTQSLTDRSIYPQLKNRSGNVLQRVRATTGVRGLLTVNGQFATLSEAAIAAISELEKQLCESQKRRPRPFSPGQRLRATDSAGLYAGLQGIVVRLDNQDRGVLDLISPARHLRTSLPAQWLEPVAEAPRVGRAGVIKRFA